MSWMETNNYTLSSKLGSPVMTPNQLQPAKIKPVIFTDQNQPPLQQADILSQLHQSNVGYSLFTVIVHDNGLNIWAANSFPHEEEVKSVIKSGRVSLNNHFTPTLLQERNTTVPITEVLFAPCGAISFGITRADYCFFPGKDVLF